MTASMLKLALLACFWFFLPAFADQALPLLDSTDAVVVKVLLVESGRYAPIEDKFAAEVTAASSRLALLNFGARVRFEHPQRMSQDKLEAMLASDQREWVRAQRIDPTKEGGKAELAELLRRDLLVHGGTSEQIAEFARPLLQGEKNAVDLATRLADRQSQLHRLWRTTTLRSDGQPLVLDQLLSQDYAFWVVLGNTPLAFELVLVNFPVASTESLQPSVHGALRGGAVNGHTGPSRGTQTGTYSMVSTFPMTSNDPVSSSLRDVKRPSSAQAVASVAAVVAHELGHQIFHLGHPFGNSACVMRPPVGFRFEEWLRGLDASACPMKSEPAMTPGFVRFPDVRRKTS